MMQGNSKVTPDAVLAGIVFVSAALGSSVTWYQLAERTGWAPWLAWVPFASIDVAGLCFGRSWIAGRTARVRAWGKVTTLLTVAISVGGNSVEHAVAGGFMAISLWLTLAVGAIPAASLFAVVHQWSLKHHAQGRSGEKKSKREAPRAEPVVVADAPVQEPPANEMGMRRADRAEQVAWLRRQELETWTAQVKAVQAEFGVSRATAKRVVGELAS